MEKEVLDVRPRLQYIPSGSWRVGGAAHRLTDFDVECHGFTDEGFRFIHGRAVGDAPSQIRYLGRVIGEGFFNGNGISPVISSNFSILLV